MFTTRLDTLFGVTFMVLSTEHPFIQQAAESDPASRPSATRWPPRAGRSA